MAKTLTITLEIPDNSEARGLFKLLTTLKTQFSEGVTVKTVKFDSGAEANIYNINGDVERLDKLITNSGQEI